MKATREVVDGQQRLRTLIGYIAPALLPDYDPATDEIKVRRNHNSELAGKKFGDLPDEIQHRLLNYSFSTHVLPSSVEDRDVLHIFQRLNSTGEKLTSQELRNAKYFGEFKTTMYELAFEQLERWRSWEVFSGDEISRMKEVELTSDVVVAMLNGFGGKSQKAINDTYRDFDDEFPMRRQVIKRFRMTMDVIDEILGEDLANTVYSREIWFIVLVSFLYGELYGSSPISRQAKASRLSKGLGRRLFKISQRVRDDDSLPPEVQDALRGASSDKRSRLARLDFVASNV